MPDLAHLPLEDLSLLEARYKPLSPDKRASALLSDLKTAFDTAQTQLYGLITHPQTAKTLAKLRTHPAISGKMRASEAKSALLDAKNDFVELSRQKLAATIKTLERLSGGEGLADGHISAGAPIALSVRGMEALGGYFSILQLALTELAKTDAAHVEQHSIALRLLRRCATKITDSLIAAALAADIR